MIAAAFQILAKQFQRIIHLKDPQHYSSSSLASIVFIMRDYISAQGCSNMVFSVYHVSKCIYTQLSNATNHF